ncbi:MAG TPA: alkaline phosphatase family protein [Candidatus Acidoferrum sp.]
MLTQYYGTGHVSLDNYIAMLSGQAATPQTRNDSTTYTDYIVTGVTPDGQAIGTGCVILPRSRRCPINSTPSAKLGTPTPFPQTTTITPTILLTFQDYGGDRTGAVLLSPFLKPGTVSDTPFNHFSLLKSLEDIFDTDEYLGYAGQPGLVGFFGCVTSDIAAKDRDQFPRCENH